MSEQTMTLSKAATMAIGGMLNGWTVDLPGRQVRSPEGTVTVECADHLMIRFVDLDGAHRTVQFRRGATFGAVAKIAQAVAGISDDMAAAHTVDMF